MTSRFYQDRLIAVVGPTASGKTALAIRLAQAFDGAVISADSRYLYRGMDIGTDKPTVDDRATVAHHLIDILDPSDNYSLALYQRDARAAIDATLARGRLPILAGGTPLYVNAVLEGWQIPEVEPNPEIRSRLQSEAGERGLEHLHRRLAEVDPDAALRIPATNLRRVIRALEVYEVTGVPMTAQEGKSPPPYRILKIGLRLPRDVLYQRIDARIEAQIRSGLVEEVRGLLERGVPTNAPSMSAIGYRDVLPYLRGEIDERQLIANIQASTHRYVRHQMTWLRRMPEVHWVDVLEDGSGDAAMLLARHFLHDETVPGDRA